jgi:hypothetical protein
MYYRAHRERQVKVKVKREGLNLNLFEEGGGRWIPNERRAC